MKKKFNNYPSVIIRKKEAIRWKRYKKFITPVTKQIRILYKNNTKESQVEVNNLYKQLDYIYAPYLKEQTEFNRWIQSLKKQK